MTYPARPVPPAPRVWPWWLGPVLLIGATMLNLGCGPDVATPLPPSEARVRWVDELEAGARCYYARGDYRSIVCERAAPREEE